MTILNEKTSAFKPYKPMETGHSSSTMRMRMMMMMKNSSRNSPPPPPPPPLELFPLKPSFLRKEGDFRRRKQDERIKEDDVHNGFTDLRLGLGRNPLKELSLIQRHPPPPPPPSVVLGRRKREYKNPDLVSIKRIRNDSQLSSQTKQKLKRDYQDMGASTSKQTFSSRSVHHHHHHHNDEQETFSSSMEIETSNNSSSTLTHEVEAGEIPKERRTFLFEKLITAKDMGDFNRLLIPVKCAATFFPQLQMTPNECKPEMLKITDNQNCNWDIMYEYWGRSKRYVLTKGWKTFVTHHKLQFNDIIRVYKLADDGIVDGYKRYGVDFYRPMKMIRLFGQDIYADYSKIDGVGFVEDERQHSNEGR